MAYLLRMIPGWGWFVVGCLIAGVPQFAFADTYPVQTWYQPAGHPEDVSPDINATGTKACTYDIYGPYSDWRFSLTLSKTPPSPWSYGSTTGVHCYKSAGWVNAAQMTKIAKCPYGGTVSGTSCINAPACTSPQVRDPVTGECLAPPEPCAENAGKWWSEGYGWNSMFPVENFGSGEGDSLPDTGCVQGCTVTYDRSSGGYGSGRYWFVASAKATGESCTVTQPQPPSPDTGPKTPETSPEYDCAKNGQGWGTVNGTVICTGPATNQTTKDKETTKTTNPDSTTTETTKETSCTGGTCTETTTTTNCDASGNNCTTSTSTSTKTGTGESEEDGGEPESKWGGNCSGGFVCSGDAIQCAIAKEQHIRNCELEPAQAHKDRGQNVIDGVLEANDPRRAENKDSEAFGTWASEGGMSGTCPADFSVELRGQTIVVPWSDLCPHFNAMGYAMLAIAWVIAASVLRGVL